MSAGIRAIILTLLLAAGAYFAGNARMQLWDRDEPRYAECSRQMLESGDWVVPRLYDKLRFQKPPLIYWCQASAMKLFGSQGGAGAMAARLPSVIAMLATLIILSIVLAREAGIEQSAWTVFIFASSAMTIVAAKSCLTDGVLLLFILIAQLCLYALWQGNQSWKIVIILSVALGLGLLTKGPFIIGIVAATGAALGVFHVIGKILSRRKIEERGFDVVPANNPSTDPSPPVLPVISAGRRIPTIPQMAVGILVIAAIVVPWIVLVSHRAPDFLPAMLHEGRQHALEGKEGHHFPPGYHLVLVWPMFMPWSLLLPLGIGVGIAHRRDPAVRFALAAVVGPWLMVEFIGTKLPHYFLPAYPAMAFLVAFALRQCLRTTTAHCGDDRSLEDPSRRGKWSAAPDPGAILEENPGRRSACPGVEVIHTGDNPLESPSFFVANAIWSLAIIAVFALPWLGAGSIKLGRIHIGGSFRPLPWVAMINLTSLGLILGIGVFLLFLRRQKRAALITMGVGMFVSIGFASSIYFPDAPFLRVSNDIAGILQQKGAIHPGDVKMVDYKEPSLGFYQGGTIREVEKKADLIYKPIDQWPHWVVITGEAWDMVPADTRKRLRIVDSRRGWAYADQGRVVEVLVVENPVY